MKKIGILPIDFDYFRQRTSMLILLSPSKNLHNTPKEAHRHSLPRFPDETLQLIEILRKQKPKSLQLLMDINDKLANLNFDRYHTFTWPHNETNATAALMTFRGEVYLGLEANTMTKATIEEADKRIRILSGLYGLLRPLDLIRPYRLEMGVELKVGRNKDLYSFWGNKITNLINEDVATIKAKEIINLASQEYSHAVQFDKLSVPVVDVQFLENRNGKLQFLSFIAKRSRGMMARLIVENKIKSSKDLRESNIQGYTYNPDLSDSKKMVFVR